MSDQTEMNDNIRKLQNAGLDIDKLPEAQRQILKDLSPDEVDVLVKVHQRVQDAGDVQGYLAAPPTGYIFY